MRDLFRSIKNFLLKQVLLNSDSGFTLQDKNLFTYYKVYL